MGLSGCYAIMKYLVFFLNFIFWVSGLCIIVLSVWMLTDPTFYVSLAQDESSYYSGTYLLLAVGILLFIVGFLGCCGTLQESQIMLVLFFCVLMIILVAEISAAAWVYANSDKLEALVEETVRTTVKQEYGVVPSRTKTFDAIQSGLYCCGAKGNSDWAHSKFNGELVNEEVYSLAISAPQKKYNVPLSCCSVNATEYECEQAVTIPAIGASVSPLIYKEGCTKRLLQVLDNYAKMFVGVGVAIGVAQLMGLIFALLLCCALQQNSYKA